jgi:putative PIN family toxin of toxin-antitoxin system
MMAAKRVVFDCHTLLQGLASPGGPAGRCVQLALEGKVGLFISPAAFEELRDVTSRPRVIAKLGLAAERVQEFMEAVEIAATVLSGFPEVFTYQRDPDDAHYVNLALAADAKLIVSRDRDLLDLMDAGKPEAADFQRRFPGLRILEPVAYLREIGELV